MSNTRELFDTKNPNTSTQDDDGIIESDIELDVTDVVEPDDDTPQKMVNRSADVMEENCKAAQIAKSRAMEAIAQGKLDDAIDHLTEAIMLNPTSAILYSTRASVFAKLNKSNAAIRDADAALEINPDSAKGYKVRGMARAMFGQWEEAAKDLLPASKLDYDEEIGLVLKKVKDLVEPSAQRIEEHRRKYERLRKEREVKKAEFERQQQQAQEQDQDALSALNDGEVISIHSAGELEKKLNAATRTSRLAILYFTATWCGPCRFISPLYTGLAAKYPKVVFLKVDIDEAREVAGRWNVNSVPTFFFLKNGEEVDKVVGVDKDALERKIAQHAG
ncbi:TPR repeat-containing thioredoxin TDX-like [Juglans regia]|uniref:TPR repeat-containing thioredoxin TDX n=1 Tax=Juglans regia TaxID=51240 RepID=A0A6P9ERJ4_JUGRE|nr:TPR repeat-containing thioredoxin TDX-like [Juglans regia]